MKEQLSVQEERRQYERIQEELKWDVSPFSDIKRISIEITPAVALVFEYQRNKLTSWLEISTGTMGFDQAWDSCSLREDPLKWMQRRVAAVNTLFGFSKQRNIQLPIKDPEEAEFFM